MTRHGCDGNVYVDTLIDLTLELELVNLIIFPFDCDCASPI